MERDNRLDHLKAISIILVLARHLEPIKINSEASSAAAQVLQYLVEFFNNQVTLIAVPTFLIVSLYLFSLKIEKLDFFYLKKRVAQLFKVFLFWSLIQITVSFLVTHKLPPLSKQVLMGVLPGLPIVGDSVLYYLFVLIVLTLTAFVYSKIAEKYRNAVGVAVVILSLIYFEVASIFNRQIFYYESINFFIYIPIALLLSQHKERILKLKFIILSLYMLFSVHDAILFQIGHSLNHYGRVSVVLGGLALFCFVYQGKDQPRPILQTISKYSLGYYAMHKYWQCLFLLTLQSYNIRLIIPMIELNIAWLIAAVMTVLFTAITVHFLSMTKLKQFVA